MHIRQITRPKSAQSDDANDFIAVLNTIFVFVMDLVASKGKQD